MQKNIVIKRQHNTVKAKAMLKNYTFNFYILDASKWLNKACRPRGDGITRGNSHKISKYDKDMPQLQVTNQHMTTKGYNTG